MPDFASALPGSSGGPSRPRNKIFAATCSLFVPGSGQIYLGHVAVGLTWLAGVVSLYTVAILLFKMSPPLGLVSLLLPLGVHLICFIDALDPQSLGPPRDAPIPAPLPPSARRASPWPVRIVVVGLVGIFLLCIVEALSLHPLFGAAGYDRPITIPEYHVTGRQHDVVFVVLDESPSIGDSLWTIVHRLQGDRPSIVVHFWTSDYQSLAARALPISHASACAEFGEITVDRTTGVRRFSVPSRAGCR
ncbi:MAG TPA: hypothetical protein VNE16_13855 [Vicinamibacterales bacterium]|nr:hypothetical protein [Vicinamibacterales bacterium]